MMWPMVEGLKCSTGKQILGLPDSRERATGYSRGDGTEGGEKLTEH